MPNRWAGSVFQMVTETENLCTLRVMLPPSLICITLSTAAKIVTARLNSRHTSWLQQLLWHIVLLPLLCRIVTLSFNCAAYGLLSLVSHASPACRFRRCKMVAAGRSLRSVRKTKQLPKYMRPYFICIYLNVVIAQYLNKFSIWPSLSYYTPQINKYLIEIH